MQWTSWSLILELCTVVSDWFEFGTVILPTVSLISLLNWVGGCKFHFSLLLDSESEDLLFWLWVLLALAFFLGGGFFFSSWFSLQNAILWFPEHFGQSLNLQFAKEQFFSKHL